MPRLTIEQVKNCFVRQEDDYSCGPACLATIARLCGSERDYAFFRGLLGPRPFIGSHPHAMIDAAIQYLPFTNAGDKRYDGGLAVGYILHPEDKIDHYVVYLTGEKEKVVYYDPYDDTAYIKDTRKMELRSTFFWPGIDHALQAWALTFKPVEGLSFAFCKDLVAQMPKQPRPWSASPTRNFKMPSP